MILNLNLNLTNDGHLRMTNHRTEANWMNTGRVARSCQIAYHVAIIHLAWRPRERTLSLAQANYM